jgi:DNA-binding MarR family transcriptional regulator
MAKIRDEPLLQLWDTSWRMTRKAEQELEEFGLRRSEIIVMVLLNDGPMVQSALARAAGMPESTLSDVVDRLERLYYVERSEDPFDRRYKHVSVTNFVGEHVARVAFATIQEIEIRVDSRLVADRLERLMTGNRLRDRVRPRRPSTRPRGRSRLGGVL